MRLFRRSTIRATAWLVSQFMDVHSSKGWRNLAGRMLGSIGVVYGDIGTSVLYALHESFFGHFRLNPTEDEVLSVLSFFFWSLLVIVGFKYVLLVMRADNRGEGGIFSLLALINGVRARLGPRKISLIWGLIIFGAALLLADGLITPAISVLSSVSGLEVLAPSLKSSVVPITVVILILLFAVQPFGTHRIGQVFGPIMLLWFVAIILVALPHIAAHPRILMAVNPYYGVMFVVRHGWQTLLTLGAVVLCITGGEALYADMGHFGRKPIALSWWFIVLPALLINYFGQGALLLTPGVNPGDNLFYSLVPPVMLIPMIVLATVATIIASQALISGSFSLIQQAIALGAFPRERIVHTNAEIEGQIYLPAVNWTLMVGCILLVVSFKTSGALAAAYGIAVTGTMGITTIAFYLVARHVWHWPLKKAGIICAVFLSIDLTFFGANLLKFFSGGYVPILVALELFAIMHSWYWGRGFIARCYQFSQFSTVRNLLDTKNNPETTLLDRSLVVLASRPVSTHSDTIPPRAPVAPGSPRGDLPPYHHHLGDPAPRRPRDREGKPDARQHAAGRSRARLVHDDPDLLRLHAGSRPGAAPPRTRRNRRHPHIRRSGGEFLHDPERRRTDHRGEIAAARPLTPEPFPHPVAQRQHRSQVFQPRKFSRHLHRGRHPGQGWRGENRGSSPSKNPKGWWSGCFSTLSPRHRQNVVVLSTALRGPPLSGAVPDEA